VGRPAKIDRDNVLDTALALADTSGLENVTMQRVAERLGVTPMALYRCVASKAALLDGLVERLLAEINPPPASGNWREQLHGFAEAARQTGHRHPQVFPLLLQRPAVTAAARQVRDNVRRLLRQAGVPGGQVARLERLLSTAILGFTVSEVAGRFGHHPRPVLDDDFAQLQSLLTLAIDTERARKPTHT
jgi:AcrR family transcriptional regulator